ncbi:hypothetical protein BDP27DRAFT_1327326 [Rhodocollybia butyracea]|uniref:Uncharacterized protein n=1 Tax=Rhodocollybia butyracea TaxID=206335 RepID=A0A9P5PUP3_9AGAR|nr:hypothetical protein BDP27DRAFT_1327326 [Rhodocollybia butyracea]
MNKTTNMSAASAHRSRIGRIRVVYDSSNWNPTIHHYPTFSCDKRTRLNIKNDKNLHTGRWTRMG